MKECKHLLPTNCPPHKCTLYSISLSITAPSNFRIFMGTRIDPPYVNLFMGKEEHTIILTFLHLIFFWKRFTDDIFFIFLGSHSQLKSLMTFMNTISPTLKYTFTYSEQTAIFLDVQIYLSETRKLKAKLYRKPTDSMSLLRFNSHHPLCCE